jgi:hypothetical protein
MNLTRHALPKNAGRYTCRTQWSFHLKCGKDHDGCHQIHSTPKGSLGSHLSLRDPIHVGHYMLDGQCFEFLGDIFSTTAHASLGEPNDPHYVFLVAYRNVKAFRH